MQFFVLYVYYSQKINIWLFYIFSSIYLILFKVIVVPWNIKHWQCEYNVEGKDSNLAISKLNSIFTYVIILKKVKY